MCNLREIFGAICAAFVHLIDVNECRFVVQNPSYKGSQGKPRRGAGHHNLYFKYMHACQGDFRAVRARRNPITNSDKLALALTQVAPKRLTYKELIGK